MRVVQKAVGKQSKLWCLQTPASFFFYLKRSPLANARHWHELALVDRHELT